MPSIPQCLVAAYGNCAHSSTTSSTPRLSARGPHQAGFEQVGDGIDAHVFVVGIGARRILPASMWCGNTRSGHASNAKAYITEPSTVTARGIRALVDLAASGDCEVVIGAASLYMPGEARRDYHPAEILNLAPRRDCDAGGNGRK